MGGGMRLVGLLAAILAFVPLCASAVVVSVTGGDIRGEDQADGSAIYRGIPYAAPPVGHLRWKPPAPVVAWPGTRDALKPAAPCVQHDEGWNHADGVAGQENCLYLSVHTPAHKPGDRLPVMFWIHGGSNMAGSGWGYVESDIHKQGVVLVSIEYRLGVFGFLASSELAAESPHHTSGNYGLLDQIAALKWVQANIASFGGDPGNVTIFGQSAGAYDVELLMVSPSTRGLFNKAIVESAGGVAPSRTKDEGAQLAGDFASSAGVTASGAKRLKALRAMPVDQLVKAADKVKAPPGDFLPAWGVVIGDGWSLPLSPADAFAKGQQARVPLIIGNNAREFGDQNTLDKTRAIVTGAFGTNAPKALAFYGLDGKTMPPDDPVLGSVSTQIITDIVFRCPASEVAAYQVDAGARVWRYQFGWPRPGQNGPTEHSAELQYVFGQGSVDEALKAKAPVQAYWVNFAKTGSPNGANVPGWPPFGTKANYLDLTQQGPKAGMDLRGGLCRLLRAKP